METNDKKRKIKNFNAELSEDSITGFEGMSTASSTEATGIMYCPPRSEDEMRSEEQLFTLQTGMPSSGYVGKEREWRADIERFYYDEAKVTPKKTHIDDSRNQVLYNENRFADLNKEH